MKYITFIACTLFIAFSLTAFINSNLKSSNKENVCSQSSQEIEPPTFSYGLSSLTNNTVTKERIHSAKTIADLMPDHSIKEDLNNNITSLRDVKIRIAATHGHCSKGTTEIRNGNSLSEEQVKLLKSTDYATIFSLEGYITTNKFIPDLNNARYFNYNMAVVPETQATYKAGNDALIDYLSTKCQSTIAKVQRGNLKSGNISFTVTKVGTISDIEFNSTCGYPSVDVRMMELMKTLPEVWNVATDSKGEKLDQTLVFSYGMGGC